MVKKGMNVTKDQRGEVPQEAKIDSSSAAVNSQMKRRLLKRMMTSIKYAKAYYAALLQKQRQAKESAKKQQSCLRHPSPMAFRIIFQLSSGKMLQWKTIEVAEG